MFVDDFQSNSTLFNNETADKCGRLVKGATSTEGRRGLTPRHHRPRWLNSKHQVLTQWKEGNDVETSVETSITSIPASE
jgi:hypothetical protein